MYYSVTNENYYSVTNLQGDVIAILDDNGTAVVTYTYDAWGNILSVGGSMADTLGVYNPLRYRGYVYDEETSLYYLQSRYYDPNMGRFLNTDAFATTGQGLIGNNMFVYCGNNPILYSDYSGYAHRPSIVAINDGGRSATGWEIYSIIAQTIGFSAEVEEDYISIDLEKCMDTIDCLHTVGGVSMNLIMIDIAAGACDKYKSIYGKEFLLSDSCVGYELYDHFDAYQWARGCKFLPNTLAAGFYAKRVIERHPSPRSEVARASRVTDIRIADVYSGSWSVELFGYKKGIRDCYIGSPLDPWADER